MRVYQYDTLLMRVELTTYCNAQCDFCVNSMLERKHMDYSTLFTVFDRAKEANIDNFTFAGCGEPGMYPLLTDAIRLFSTLGHVRIITNGTASYARDCDIQMSFHGDVETHARITKLSPKYIEQCLRRLPSKAVFQSHVAKVHSDRFRPTISHNWCNSDVKHGRKQCTLMSDAVEVDVDGNYRVCCTSRLSNYPLGSVYDLSVTDMFNSKAHQMLVQCMQKYVPIGPCRNCSYIGI